MTKRRWNVLLAPIIVISMLLMTAGFVYASSTLMEEYWVSNGFSGMCHAENTWHAQTFMASSTYDVTAVELQFIRNSGTPGNATVSIRNTDASGEPTGADLATSNPVNLDGLPAGNASAVHFDFNPPYLELTSGVKYALVTGAPDAIGSELYIGYHNPGGYTFGEAWQSFNAGTSWMWPDYSDTFDLLFRVYGEDQSSPPSNGSQVEVGGYVNPADKIGLLIPWLAITAVLVAMTTVFVLRRRNHSKYE